MPKKYRPRFFTMDEFDCTHTGRNEMKMPFIRLLDELRGACDFPFVITSGYRDQSHPLERDKERPGYHTKGIAVDIAVSNGHQRRILVEEAIYMGFGGIGVANSFVHVDDRSGPSVMWTYN